MTAQLIQILLGATVLWLFAFLICLSLRKHSATLRHAILASTMAGTLLVPVISPFLPRVPLILRDLPPTQFDTAQQHAAPVSTNASPATPTTHANDELSPVASNDNAAAKTPPVAKSSRFSGWPFACLCVWAIVAAAKIAGMFSSMQAARTLLHKARLLQLDGQLLPHNIAKKMRIRRQVCVVQSPDATVPYTLGLRRPVIFLPPESRDWSPSEFEGVLTHEAAHIARCDVFWQYLATFACAIYWFHPLAWFAARRMQVERELACDDAVLHHGGEADRYADTLLELAAKLKHRASPLPFGAVSMARKGTVKQRILSILNPTLNRRPLGRAKLIALIVLAIVAITVAAMLVPFGEMSENQKLARIAVPRDAVREITVKGKVLMPDGTPAKRGVVSMTSLLYISNNSMGWHSVKGHNHSQGGMTYVDDTGGFEFHLEEGSNTILSAVCDTYGGSSAAAVFLSSDPKRLDRQKLIAPPVAFVPRENGPEIVLQYEEGVFVEGTVTFDDGTPAVNQSLTVQQYVTPALGADIPAVQEKMVFTTTTRIGEDGKFALYLLPGEYTFVTSDFPVQEERRQNVVIERDKENRFALTAPSPIHVRFELKDGTLPEGLNVMHAGAYLYQGRKDSLNTFLFAVFDSENNENFDRVKYQPGDAIAVHPTDMDNYLIVTTYDNEYGLVEKITPQMRGKEITLTLRPTIKVTEQKDASQKYTREWEFQYFDAKRYSIQRGVYGKNHVFTSDENGRLTYAVPVYAGDYKGLFFFLERGEVTSGSWGESGTGRKFKRPPPLPPLFSVDPETREIKPYSTP